ncbi:hypothetical protein [uncultured Endozoicomonas sp.]|uniref:hypothetical protein n=1 Tax=uncultured Endozoicomonas sp. TaxID=432652 RepID=UPI0026092FC0|nr:hypothetical protein [uncultured Endozoicomonas sp.]
MTILTTSYSPGVGNFGDSFSAKKDEQDSGLRKASSCPNLYGSSVEAKILNGRKVQPKVVVNNLHDVEGDFVVIDGEDVIVAEVEQSLSNVWHFLQGSDYPHGLVFKKSVQQHAQDIVNGYLIKGSVEGIRLFFQQDQEKISILIKQLKVFGFDEASEALKSIEQKVWGLMFRINLLNNYENVNRYSKGDTVLKNLGEIAFKSYKEMKLLDNHIVAQFDQDVTRSMNFFAHSSKPFVKFHVCCQNGNYVYTEAELPENQGISFHTESATGKSAGNLSKGDELESARTAFSKVVQQRIIDFAETDSMTSVISDLLTQTSGNSLWFFLALLRQSEDEREDVLSAVDRQYETHFFRNDDGSVTVNTSLIAPRFTRAIEGDKFEFQQSIAIHAQVTLNPEKLDSLQFDELELKIGAPESIQYVEEVVVVG